MAEHSCGGVVYTYVNGTRHYVIVTELDGHTGLPKGHMEPGETRAETALREIREETGLHVTLHEGVMLEETYRLPHGGEKHVTYFPARFDGQTPLQDNGEVKKVAVLPLSEALDALTFAGARRILREADAFLAGAEFKETVPD